MTTVTSLIAMQASRPEAAGAKVTGTPAGGSIAAQNFLAIIAGLNGGVGLQAAVTKSPGLEGAPADMASGAALSGSIVELGGNLALRNDLSKGLTDLEKAMAAFLGNLQEQIEGEVGSLPEGSLEAMAEVVGAYLASFDADAGTAFGSKLVALGDEMAKLGLQGGLASAAGGEQSVRPEVVNASAKEVAGMLMGALSQALGVVRVVPNNAPTATQALLLSSAMEPGTPSGSLVGVDASAARSLFELPEGKVSAVQAFLSQAAKGSAEGKAILDQIASVQAGGGKALEGSMSQLGGLPKVDYARLDMLGGLHAAHSEPVDAPRFEALLSQAARAHSAEHAAQQAAPRFATLLMSQIKNANFVENRTRIELAPRGLGDIQISVETDPSGRVTALVRAENPQVLEILRTDRAQLEAMLAEKGFDMAQGDLDFEGFGGHEGNDRDEGLPGEAVAAGEVEASEDMASHANMISSDGHLNILA